MFQITEAAAQELGVLRQAFRVPEICCLRLDIEETDALLRLDTFRPGDEVFDHAGQPVLVVGRDCRRTCAGLVLDCEDSHFRILPSCELN